MLYKHQIKASVIHSENAYSFAIRFSNSVKNRTLARLHCRLLLFRCGKIHYSVWQTDKAFSCRVRINALLKPINMSSQEKTKPAKLKVLVDFKVSSVIYRLNKELLWKFNIICHRWKNIPWRSLPNCFVTF